MNIFPRSSSCFIVALAVTLIFCCLSMADAVEFAVVGPRAAAMGGAGVAVTTDALATYWNPAGLAMSKGTDIRVQGTVQATDRLGVKDTLDEINSIGTSFATAGEATAALAQLNAQLAKLNQEGASVSGVGAAGLYYKTSVGDHAIGFNISDVATGGEFTPSPLSATQTGTTLTINGNLALRGLEARQAVLSYAQAFHDRTFAFGTSFKVIQGAAYNGTVGVSTAAGDTAFREDLGKAQISTAVGIDAGAIYRPSSWLSLGVVGKDLNQPTFNAPGGLEYKLNPQVRGGLAVNPWETMTVAFDGDILSNKTLIPGIKSRVIGLGLEQTLLAQSLSLRAGATKNVADAKSKIMPTAGFGLGLWILRMDFGGGYDFDEGQAMASGSVSFTF